MNHSPETRFSLIGRLHDASDSDAWNEFVQIYQPLIHRIVQRRGLQFADAAEVTQEVLGRVSRAIDTWQPDPAKGSFRGWLYRVTRNLTIDYLRRQRTANMQDQCEPNCDLDQIVDPNVDESQEFEMEYQRQLFHWAADRVRSSFKPENWQAFWLSAVEGQTIDFVAKKLGIPRGSVYVARSRVMARISSAIRTRQEQTTGALDGRSQS